MSNFRSHLLFAFCRLLCYLQRCGCTCSEKALLQSMLHSSTPMGFSLSEGIATELVHSFTGDLQLSYLREAGDKKMYRCTLDINVCRNSTINAIMRMQQCEYSTLHTILYKITTKLIRQLFQLFSHNFLVILVVV